MPDDEDCTVCVQLLGGRKRLPRIAEVVGHDQPNLLAEHTACGIDIGNGHLRTAPKLHAGPGELTAHRASDADQDFRLSLGCKRECKCSSGEKMAHGGPPRLHFTLYGWGPPPCMTAVVKRSGSQDPALGR